jgi:DNA-binding GntR family transcriptional regulator
VKADTGLQRLERSATLADQAFAEIRAALLGGRDAPLARLSEVELAQQLSMSRTPVREALHRLSLVGLVEAAPSGGYRRRHTTPRAVREHAELRLLLEPYAAELAAKRIADGAARVQLPDLAGLDAGTPLADAAFHRAIAETSAAESLPELIIELCDLAALDASSLGPAAVPDDADDAHAEIAAAVEAGRPDDARAAMTAHLEAVAETMERAAVEHPVER